MILGITGLVASGKQVVADYLKEKYGFEILDFAKDALFAEADARGIEKTKINLSILGDELRQTCGNGVLAKALLKKIRGSKTVITGFRSLEEVDCIRNECEVGEFYLIEVYSSPVLRFKRRRPEDPQTEAEFFARDGRDIQNKGLGKVLEIADLKIENNGTQEELFAKVDEAIRKIEKGEVNE